MSSGPEKHEDGKKVKSSQELRLVKGPIKAAFELIDKGEKVYIPDARSRIDEHRPASRQAVLDAVSAGMFRSFRHRIGDWPPEATDANIEQWHDENPGHVTEASGYVYQIYGEGGFAVPEAPRDWPQTQEGVTEALIAGRYLPAASNVVPLRAEPVKGRAVPAHLAKYMGRGSDPSIYAVAADCARWAEAGEAPAAHTLAANAAEAAQAVPADNFEAAKFFHARGINVVPKKPGKKHPAVRWKELQKRRVTDDELLAWRLKFKHGLGFITGAVSGTIVIESDGPEGEAVLAEFEKEHGPLPETLTIRSGSGRGLHRHFRHPGYRVTTRANPAIKLDIKGDGGFAVLPPTGRYEVISDTLDIAELPEGLLEFIEKKAPEAKGAKGAKERVTAPQGSRDPNNKGERPYTLRTELKIRAMLRSISIGGQELPKRMSSIYLRGSHSSPFKEMFPGSRTFSRMLWTTMTSMPTI
jgi:Bifunctional DNA primase/polymerase, N-terminal